MSTITDIEVWLVNAVDKDFVSSHARRVKNVRKLIVRVELAVSDCQGHVKFA